MLCQRLSASQSKNNGTSLKKKDKTNKIQLDASGGNRALCPMRQQQQQQQQKGHWLSCPT